MNHSNKLPEFTDLDLLLASDIFPDTLQEIQNVLSGRVAVMEQDGNACTLVANKDYTTITFGWNSDSPEMRIKTVELKELIEKRVENG